MTLETIFRLIEYEIWCNQRAIAFLSDELQRVGDGLMSAARASHQLRLLELDRRLDHVFHVITHGTHHRGQLLGMITLMGQPQPFEGGDFGGWSR